MSITLDGNPAQKSKIELIKDGTDQSFPIDVINASKEQPVIVDFWAPWCGPCKTLGPTIEKVVREAKGKVKLVKVDIDANPAIAGQLRVQSIPAVFAFVDGRPVDGFMGALPESQVRQFVDRLSKMGNMAEQIAEAMTTARTMYDNKEYETVGDVVSQILAADPLQAEAYAIKAKSELEQGQVEQAQETLSAVPPEKANDPHVISAKAALDLALNPVDTSGVAKLETAILANPNDHAARIELAVLLNGSNQRAEATDQLIHIIRKERSWNDEAARKQLVLFFEAWGPKDEFTLAGRRKLSSVLFA